MKKLLIATLLTGVISQASAFTLTCCQGAGALIPATTVDMQNLRTLNVKTCDITRGRFLKSAVADGKIKIVNSGTCTAAWSREYYAAVDKRGAKLDLLNETAATPAKKSK